MSDKVKVIVLRTAGTNCDRETAFAFSYFGARVDRVHINELFRGDVSLEDYPNQPPKVQFLTFCDCDKGGEAVRFNPNLYDDGYVCLSLLGTWSGLGIR